MNLKPCPCGKTPDYVIERRDEIYGNCCYCWTVPSNIGRSPETDWNSAPRALPVVCPQCEGEGVVTDVERLKDGGEWPCIPCPTCAPFGGRGAIMVPGENASNE